MEFENDILVIALENPKEQSRCFIAEIPIYLSEKLNLKLVTADLLS